MSFLFDFQLFLVFFSVRTVIFTTSMTIWTRGLGLTFLELAVPQQFLYPLFITTVFGLFLVLA